jgi:hypothetical protein
MCNPTEPLEGRDSFFSFCSGSFRFRTVSASTLISPVLPLIEDEFVVGHGSHGSGDIDTPYQPSRRKGRGGCALSSGDHGGRVFPFRIDAHIEDVSSGPAERRGGRHGGLRRRRDPLPLSSGPVRGPFELQVRHICLKAAGHAFQPSCLLPEASRPGRECLEPRAIGLKA